ncbi:EAL domain-containing response regulator [Gynuella sp.]|uniref:EAL domain-containing response regulator n=1 Tax=Gynuella sp. TaxID=2969146 RepID=UPI003D0EE68B
MSTSLDDPIQLLILHDTQNEAEPLINLFRNSGQIVRSVFVASNEELVSLVRDSSWDLVLAKWDTETVDVPACLDAIRHSGKDIPCVVLLSSYAADLVNGAIRAGAADIAVEFQEDHILMASMREVAALKVRRRLRETDINLRDSEQRVQLLLENSKDAIAYVHEGMHIYANGTYVEMFGYSESDDLLGILFMDLIEEEKQQELKKCLKVYSDGAKESLDCNVVHENGEQFPVHIEFSGASYDGERCIQVIIRTTQVDAEIRKQLEDMSTRDLLTNLYNYQYFMNHLGAAYQQAVHSGRNSTILYVHLNNLVSLRSQVGLAGADIVLTDIATVLSKFEIPNGLLARIADDAFAFSILGQDLELANKLAAKIRKAVQEHLSEVDGRTVQTKCSIGISLVDEQCASGGEALTHAHQAAEQAQKKESGISYFDKTDIRNVADDNLGAQVTHALANDGFRLLFQPIISLRGDAREHYEVLLRLVDKNGEEVSPLEFLQTAHAINQAGRIDRWVVQNALKDLSVHRQSGSDTQVLINITSASISDPTFLPWVNSQLKENRVPGNAVVFQISQADAVAYLKPAKAFSKGLSLLHCHLSISHFGQMQEDMNIIKHLDISYIKFHPDLSINLEDQAVQQRLETIVKQVQQHNIDTVVPHIESAAMLALLWQAGVNYIQGYLLQGPVADMSYDFSDEGEEQAV